MTFTMLRSDVPSHGIQKPTPHTSLQHNVPTVAAAEVVKVVKAVAVVKPLYDVPTYSSKSILLFTTSWENPEVVPASERGRHYHWYCLCHRLYDEDDNDDENNDNIIENNDNDDECDWNV